MPDSEGNLAGFGESTENQSGKKIAFFSHIQVLVQKNSLVYKLAVAQIQSKDVSIHLCKGNSIFFPCQTL